MTQHNTDMYLFDFERTRSRVELIMHSFEGAVGVDQEELQRAWKLFDSAFGSLHEALGIQA